MSWVAVAFVGAGTLTSMIGKAQSASAQESAYQEQAQAQQYNAEIAKQNARSSWDLATASAEMQSRRAAGVIGAGVAATAQSGVAETGSALLVAKQNASNAEMDQLMIQYHGDLQARGFEAQSAQYTYAAAVAEQNKGNVEAALPIQETSSVMQGISAYLRPGMFGASPYGSNIYQGMG
jgi:hypothetical protein